MATDQLEWRVAELEKDLGKLEDVPTDIALLVASVKSLESRFKNLQRGFYFFGGSVVAASITFGFTALRVFSPTPDPTALPSAVLRAVGL
jgi:hypothetical protein